MALSGNLCSPVLTVGGHAEERQATKKETTLPRQSRDRVGDSLSGIVSKIIYVHGQRLSYTHFVRFNTLLLKVLPTSKTTLSVATAQHFPVWQSSSSTAAPVVAVADAAAAGTAGFRPPHHACTLAAQ